MTHQVKLFSPAEANKMLPTVKRYLKDLRARRDALGSHQAKIDVERVTDASPATMHRLLKELHQLGAAFHEKMEAFHHLGIELKDLDTGLIDFYTMREGELIYLCWKEGEPRVTHWHSLEGGFASRQPLPKT